MPLQITDLAKQERTATATWDGETVAFTYRPRLLTPLARLRLLAGPVAYVSNQETATLLDMAAAVQQYAKELAAILCTWDVQNKGKTLKPTAELIETLPQEFLMAVVAAMVEDARPNPQNAASSPAS